jgi:hypothetical protein
MNDERFLKDWLQDTTDDVSDPQASADKVVARLPEARQRSRWWPWLPSRRHTPNDDTPPNVTGRTRFMLSPVKSIAAGALIFALGGAMLIAQPFEEGGGIVPGAATDAVAAQDPSPFSGELHPGFATAGGYQWSIHEMTDPRLDGKAFYSGSEVSPTDDTWLGWWTLRIVNDEGAWQASFPAFYQDPESPEERGPEVVTALLYGEGPYEGLVAVTNIGLDEPYGWGVNGVVIDADTLPEPPAAAGTFRSE